MLWMLLCLVAVIDMVVVDLAPHEITVLIISQKDRLNAERANRIRNHILEQSQNFKSPRILLTHEHFANIAGAWAITPLLISNANGKSLLQEIIGDEAEDDTYKWLLVIDSQSHVDLPMLVTKLGRENHTKELFLGRGLYDQEATIIHHFAFFDNPIWFRYSSFRSGIALSRSLIKRLSQKTVTTSTFASEFVIDAAHELAMFIWDEGNGFKLTEASYLCLIPDEDVSNQYETASSEWPASSSSCEISGNSGRMSVQSERNCAVFSVEDGVCTTGAKYDPSHILFAVKTCSKFHNERLPVIKKTWGIEVDHIRYYSDVFDPSIPTIRTGVPNTDNGHCQKILVILKLLLQEIDDDHTHLAHIEWIVIADDDTLLSIHELTMYLQQFDASSDLYMGERYGFRLFAPDGLNYVTGGGGIVFSLSVVRRLVSTCVCPTESAPDDMILGICMRQLGIEPIHSDRFHQARPSDYSTLLLTNSRPISFHKFWQIDPFRVYNKWLLPDFSPIRKQERTPMNLNRINEKYIKSKLPIKYEIIDSIKTKQIIKNKEL